MNPSSNTTILNWDAEKAEKFGREIVAFRHDLHKAPMFSDEALVEVLDRYPRHRLGMFTMGHDLIDWRSWRRGDPGKMTGEQLMEAVREGRIWLNLRDTNLYLPEYHDLCEEIGAEKERQTGAPILKKDMGLLISSPNAMVFYHLDVPLSTLWHIRGDKTVYFYPRAEPFVSDETIEKFVTKEAEGQFAYQPEWDDHATVMNMQPGDMYSWGQNMPHRVQNGPTVNVSLSMEFMTPRPGPGECALCQCPPAPPGRAAHRAGPHRPAHAGQAGLCPRRQGRRSPPQDLPPDYARDLHPGPGAPGGPGPPVSTPVLSPSLCGVSETGKEIVANIPLIEA